MKNMKKLLLAFALFGSTFALQAQITAGAGLLVGMPMGDYADGVNTGVGFSLEGNYFVMDNLSVGLEVSFLSMKIDGTDGKFKFTPITVKGEYFFSEDDFRPFAGLGIGYYLVKSKVDLPFFGSVEASANGIGFSPRVGAEYSLSDLIILCANVQYNLVINSGNAGSSTNFLGIGVGVRVNVDEF